MKIAIAGYGVEGEANYKYWSQDPSNDITIVDESEQPKHPLPAGVTTLLGAGVFEKLDGFDLVIRTAGLAPYKIKTDGKIWSATNEFFEKCPAPIIGVTGTKGKGTTSSLAASILRAAGKRVHLVGNIGDSALQALPSITADDIVVFELSSFQLWDAEKSPQVAIILSIEPDHLDVHRSMEEYIEAKANIRAHQTAEDICFYNPASPYVQKIIEKYPTGEAVPYNTSNKTNSVVIESNTFIVQRSETTSSISVTELQIPGRHNQENACAAIDAALVFGVDDSAIIKGLNDFSGLPHRLKFVKEVGEVKYYDDSIATTPGSAIAALASFNAPKILILGGSSKGADFHELAEKVISSQTKAVILIGKEANRIEQALQTVHYESIYNLGTTTMPEIVAQAQKLSHAGDIVILSPSCASFDMFKSYSDRGDQFIAAVNSLR